MTFDANIYFIRYFDTCLQKFLQKFYLECEFYFWWA